MAERYAPWSRRSSIIASIIAGERYERGAKRKWKLGFLPPVRFTAGRKFSSDDSKLGEITGLLLIGKSERAAGILEARERTYPRHVVTWIGSRRQGGTRRSGAARNCFSPIRRHYHAPSCSNGFVKCQTGNSVLLCPALRSASTVAKTPLSSSFAAVTRLCGEIVVAPSPPLPPLHILPAYSLFSLPFSFLSSNAARGKEPLLFFQGERRSARTLEAPVGGGITEIERITRRNITGDYLTHAGQT